MGARKGSEVHSEGFIMFWGPQTFSTAGRGEVEQKGGLRESLGSR